MSRVLLAEDELLISMMLEDQLRDLGHCVVGTATTVTGALSILRAAAPDAAVIDFKLADGACYPLLAALKTAGIPFVLVTGSSIDASDARLAGADVLMKPLDLDDLTTALEKLRFAHGHRRVRSERGRRRPAAEFADLQSD